MTMLIPRRIVDGIFIPASVSDSLQYYLFYGINESDLLPILDREKIYFMVRYMLSKHFGDILGFKFIPKVTPHYIALAIKEVTTKDKKYVVDGEIRINPFNSSMHTDLKLVGEEDSNIRFSKPLEEGVANILNNKEIEVRFYI